MTCMIPTWGTGLDLWLAKGTQASLQPGHHSVYFMPGFRPAWRWFLLSQHQPEKLGIAVEREGDDGGVIKDHRLRCDRTQGPSGVLARWRVKGIDADHWSVMSVAVVAVTTGFTSIVTGFTRENVEVRPFCVAVALNSGKVSRAEPLSPLEQDGKWLVRFDGSPSQRCAALSFSGAISVDFDFDIATRLRWRRAREGKAYFSSGQRGAGSRKD